MGRIAVIYVIIMVRTRQAENRSVLLSQNQPPPLIVNQRSHGPGNGAYIRIALDCRKNPADIIIRDHIIVIDKDTVFAGCLIEQRVPAGPARVGIDVQFYDNFNAVNELLL